MRKLLFIAVLTLFAVNVASAQDAEELKASWQKTITVPASEAPLIEKLFTAWGHEFPGMYVDAFNQFKQTGKANDIDYYGNPLDFTVDFAPKNGYIEISTADTMIAEVDGNFNKGDTIIRRHILTSVYWSLKNGNKLFAVSINDDGEVFAECALMFYEYDATKGKLSPRPEIVKNVLDNIHDDEDTFVILPKEGRDLHYIDYFDEGKLKTIKWNGNGF